MKVEQVKAILSDITAEILGESVIVNEDLSNVVEVGTAILNSDNGLDNYVRSLLDHIGRVVFVDRTYKGRVPSVVRDAWEYGAVLEKISMKMPDAEENESWELTDGVMTPTYFTPRPFRRNSGINESRLKCLFRSPKNRLKARFRPLFS